MKVIILGGRSGTSAMYRILRTSFPQCWGHTEPPGLSDFILDNIGSDEILKEGLQPLKDYDLAKCPEFAFCTMHLKNLFTDVRFIWMDRPLIERVESHKALGWHKDISDRIRDKSRIAAAISWLSSADGHEFGEDPVKDDLLYFRIMDAYNESFAALNPLRVLRIHYSDFNELFDFTMARVAGFLGIDKNPEWEKLKNKKHQAGRWQPK